MNLCNYLPQTVLRTKMSSVIKQAYLLFQYLTTVIPYHANQGPPTIDQLQIYIKSKSGF